MISFSNKHISFAGIADSAAITRLLNSAYRGEESKKGWTTEAHLIAGPTRSDETEIIQLLNTAVFLKYTDEKGRLTGCVNLQQHGQRIYLGMFSVSPELQGGGIGKSILGAAEEYALAQQCSSIYMTVIALREELVAWYMRHGYRDTGERKILKEESHNGHHLQELEMLVLEKQIN